MSEKNKTPELTHHDSWRGVYRQVSFLINNRKLNLLNEEVWTFYLLLHLESFPNEVRDKILPVTYYTKFGTKLQVPINNPLQSLNWHGDMTWISIEGNGEYLKAGCDYRHLFDKGNVYTKESVLSDVISCIDSLYELFPAFVSAEKLSEISRKKFRGIDSKHDYFDKDANPIEVYL